MEKIDRNRGNSLSLSLLLLHANKTLEIWEKELETRWRANYLTRIPLLSSANY